MKDDNKTKSELINELKDLRQRVIELEASETKCQKVQKSLRESVEHYRTMIESSHEVVFSKDRDGRYHSLNLNAAIGLGGTCIEDVTGKTDYDLLPREQATALQEIDI